MVTDIDEYRAKKQQEDEAKCLLPDWFWEARPELAAIRAGSRAKMISPETGLLCVLTRISAIGHMKAADDYRPRLPDIIIRPSPISLYGAILGDSGAGKTGGQDLAGDLIPHRPEWAAIGKRPSTGEAIADKFWGYEEEVDDKGKVKLVSARKLRSWLMSWDEGGLLEGLAGRAGSTLIPDLDSAWSSAGIGNETSSDLRAGRTRSLEPFSYQVSVLMGIQPDVAGFLLAQASNGLAQRFVWAASHDPDASAAHCVRGRLPPLGWAPPKIDGARGITGDGCYMMGVPRAAEADIRERRESVLKRLITPDPLDAHHHLNQLRVAGNLAILGQRADVDDDDWALAAAFLAASDATRAIAVKRGQEIGADVKRDKLKEAAAITVKSEEAREELFIARAKKRILKLLAEQGPLTVGQLQEQMTENQRGFIHETIDRLAGNGLIRKEGNQWKVC